MHALFNRLPLIEKFFPSTKGNFNLRVTLFEINLKRHDRHALLRTWPFKPVNLAAVKQKLPRPHGVDFDVSLNSGIRIDMAIHQKSLAADNPDKGLVQIDFAFANRFDFMTGQTDSRFIAFENEIIKFSSAIE